MNRMVSVIFNFTVLTSSSAAIVFSGKSLAGSVFINRPWREVFFFFCRMV